MLQQGAGNGDDDVMIVGESHPDALENGKAFGQQGRSDVSETLALSWTNLRIHE